jgi:hypothetical protein
MIKYYVKHKVDNIFIYQLSCTPIDNGLWQVPPGTNRVKILAPIEFQGSILPPQYIYDTEYDARAAAINEIRIDEKLRAMKKNVSVLDKDIFKKIVKIKVVNII